MRGHGVCGGRNHGVHHGAGQGRPPEAAGRCQLPAGAGWLDLYDQTLRVTLVAKLRDEQRFPSVDALRAQIAADVAETKRLLGVTG